MTMPKSSGPRGKESAAMGEVVLVVDVGSFASKGFSGVSSFQGSRLEIDFDDEDKGLWLTKEMTAKLAASEGSPVEMLFEDEGGIKKVDSHVASIGDRVRVSSSQAYYLIGQAGGGILRIRKP